MKTIKFKRKDGLPTKYAFICGHVERVKVKEDNLFSYEVELYKEAGCNVYQIRGFKYVKGLSSCDRLFWESVDTNMKDAIKMFKNKIKEVKK